MKQAVILAAGEGQRLRPFTVNKPKVMLSIAGKPILQYVVEAVANNGIRDVVIVVGYRREQIFDYFGTGEQFGADITYIAQDQQLGTAHALAHVKGAVGDEFLVLPGDNLIEADTIARFIHTKPNAVLAKKKMDNTLRYGVIMAEDGIIKRIVEKPKEDSGNVSIVNTGVYSFTTEIFDYLDAHLDIPDVLETMIDANQVINVEETDGTWLDVVYPWDILELNNIILRQMPAQLGGTIEASTFLKGMVSIGADTVVRSNSYIRGPVVIGENCEIGPNISIMPSTCIGDNVVISPFTEINNCVIGDDVSIGASSIVQDSVIDEGCVIKGHFTACSGQADLKINEEYHSVNIGAILGTGCNLGNNVVAQPGTIIGNYSRINSMKLVSGKLADKSLVL